MLAREAIELGDHFEPHARLSDPRYGEHEGIAGIHDFVFQFQMWLAEHRSTADHVATTSSAKRSVVEWSIRLDPPDAVELPVAFVADLSPGSGRISWLRIYHSMWPLTGGHRLRSPLLEGQSGCGMDPPVDRYQAALAAGDADLIVDQFEDAGYAREPAGGEWVYRGKERLREFYGMLFSNGGGIPLEHCTVTDDGTRCAVEYNAVAWGATPMPAQAGVAVYERGASGLLAAARIYDDVDPPL